ncbi:MAG: dicarboxylate/amino acid:cation symporter [Bdellovibrionales bacterium]
MKPPKYSLTTWILLALASGALTGLALNQISLSGWAHEFLVEGIFKVGGDAFFALLKMLVVPVVFVSLVGGVGALDDVKKMGRIGAKTFVLYLATTATAITLAIGVAGLTNPGKGFDLPTQAEFAAKESPGLAAVLLGFIPTNPIQAMAEGNMIQVILLALLVGLSLSLSGPAGRRVLAQFNDWNEVIMKVVLMVMVVAPVGVFCLIARVFTTQGFSAIAPLSIYFFTVLATLALHFSLVYMGLLKVLGRLNPLTFLKKFRQVMVFAFSTSSSNATLPANLEVTEKRLGVKNSVAAFTLPLGATVNMDGTAIMQGVATVFISQAYNIEIGLGGYVSVILTATVASIGTAGVPGVGLVTLAMVLKQVGLPVEGIGLIIGVDRLLDMARTVVNVTGDAAVTCVVAQSEGQLDRKIFES